MDILINKIEELDNEWIKEEIESNFDFNFTEINLIENEWNQKD